MNKIDLINWTQSNLKKDIDGFIPPADMRLSISQVKELPPFPATAQRILQLASDPLADARKLSKIIELDPLLTAQVVRWANSALYGYKGKINSPYDAISKVLGFDFVFNLTLGLATLSSLKVPKEGVIGSQALWVQSLVSSRLMNVIAQKIPKEIRPDSQHIFLTGLLHNIGFLLLGHQFSDEYHYLTQLITANPTQTIYTIENFAFGYNHAQLGGWLMQSWSMPKEIVDAVYHHHNPNYRGENHPLNLLVFLNDYLLGEIGIGDAIHSQCPDSVFTELSVDKSDCELFVETISQDIESITQVAGDLLIT